MNKKTKTPGFIEKMRPDEIQFEERKSFNNFVL